MMKGMRLFVVLSVTGETDRLINLTKDISDDFNKEEYDVVISSGEQVSVGLLAAALHENGISAKS